MADDMQIGEIMFFKKRPHPTFAELREEYCRFDSEIVQGQQKAYTISGITQKSLSEYKQGALYQRYSKGLPLEDQN